MVTFVFKSLKIMKLYLYPYLRNIMKEIQIQMFLIFNLFFSINLMTHEHRFICIYSWRPFIILLLLLLVNTMTNIQSFYFSKGKKGEILIEN